MKLCLPDKGREAMEINKLQGGKLPPSYVYDSVFQYLVIHIRIRET